MGDRAFATVVKLPAQRLRMVAQVVLDETLDEPVAVVVARLPAKMQCLSVGDACAFEGFGAQLRVQEFVGIALVDEQGAREARAVFDQCSGVVSTP